MNQIKNYTLPVLVLLSGIFLSTISAYYSILGLISIFSGSALLITLMGVGLESSKIMACVWLHKHWQDKIGFLKLYLSIAIIILMLITSLGIYGFLTKANLKQSEGVNLNLAKVSALENNIAREQSRLDLNSNQITQYNDLLSKLTTKDVRRASNERRRIQSEIKVLSKESKEIAKTIDNLNTELLPYKSEINAVEVEVGTLLYISKLIYGDNYKEYLPQTLTVLTLLIIFVFDPLAIGLLIASQKSFRLITKKEVNPIHDGKKYNDVDLSKYIIVPEGEIWDKNVIKKSAPTKVEDSYLEDAYDGRKEPDTIPNSIVDNIIKSEALGEEFEKVLDDNRWEMYEAEALDLFGGKSPHPYDYYEPGIDDEYVNEGVREEDIKVSGRLPKRHRQNGRKI